MPLKRKFAKNNRLDAATERKLKKLKKIFVYSKLIPIFASGFNIESNASGRFRTKNDNIMTRQIFNQIAKARFEGIVGIPVEVTLINAKEGIFVSVIAEGNRTNELSVLPNLDGEIEFDEELNETFAYVKLS